MKTTTWAVFGSLFINLMLALLIATVFSVAPAARAEACSQQAASVPAKQAPARHAPASGRGYVVAARMGWAMG